MAIRYSITMKKVFDMAPEITVHTALASTFCFHLSNNSTECGNNLGSVMTISSGIPTVVVLSPNLPSM